MGWKCLCWLVIRVQLFDCTHLILLRFGNVAGNYLGWEREQAENIWFGSIVALG